MCDISRQARELTQRGLDDYACGRLREAVLAWERAAHLAPQVPPASRLLEFARKRVRERDTRPTAHGHGETRESPIPGFLASLTVVEADEQTSDGSEETLSDEEWAEVDTRRVVAAAGEAAARETGQDAQNPADTWKELPIQDDKLQASARGLADECQAALKAGRADNAALAAETALRLCEEARSAQADSIIESARLLFERAFCACIGDMKAAPIRAIPAEELDSHGFDHRAAFLMSRMDGILSVDDLLDIAGIPRFDALRVMASLRRAQAVDLVPVG